MKIIQESLAGKSPETTPWWVGKQVTCNCCHRIVELELNDLHAAEFLQLHPDEVEIRCAVCGHTDRLCR